MLVVTVVWVLTMESFGFIFTTFLFLMISSLIFGSKSWPKILIMSAVMPLVIYFIFWGLKAMLPEGPLESMIRSFFKINRFGDPNDV